MTPVFETRRLIFRRFEPSDLAALADISSDEQASRYVGDGRPLTLDETRTWIENSRRNVDTYGYGTGAVVDRESGMLIGWAGFARPGDGTEEIIYGFGRDHWGRGLGTELLAGIIRWARDELNLTELRATVSAENRASIAMLQRQGFRLVDDCYAGEPDTHLYVTRLHRS